MNEILAVNKLSKVFKENKAVDDVSFQIRKGEIVALLGPNGAGKTTTISMLLGLIKPTNGDVKVFNRLPTDKKVREQIGAMLQEISVMDRVKVKELLSLIRGYYQNPFSLNELIEMTGFNEKQLQLLTDKLSGGQKRRLGFALALAGNPDLLILDEPTVGMDISARQKFWESIKRLSAQGKTVVFTTHYLQEADDTADRILLFNKGRIVADGKPKDLKAKLAKKVISFEMNPSIQIELLEQLPEISNITRMHNRLYIQTNDTDAVLYMLFNENMQPRDIQIESGRLEEAFEELTKPLREVI
ncbi:ABC transporter ATP-binding protein [Falsibacillus albus]|uniref:ABC transporter ATP-binding protein n=1 Tax=Falsibacillus albus TaxID=2478915 RepID=A0A3L7JSF8_9BACI|nr:ABC transporter ATP-binding protein [Falsibacillus albus]RLQ93205.1 ABC transporter ATP-binding protein [Falsibacillus albus]